jgi:hypothetical protein
LIEELGIEKLGEIVGDAMIACRTDQTLVKTCARDAEESRLGLICSSEIWNVLTTENLAGTKLENFIRSLPRGELSEAIAVMLVGRGDCTVSQFRDQVADINGAPDTYDADYLCAKLPMLPQYLIKGIMLLR